MAKRNDTAVSTASTGVNAAMTRIMAIIAIPVALVLLGCYAYFLSLEKLFEHLAPEVVLITALFPMTYFIFWRKGILIGDEHSMNSIVSSDYVKEFFIRHDEVDWDAIIVKAREIDIAVFYYGGWVRDHHDSFVEFFRKKGRLSLILSDPEDSVILLTLQRYFFPGLSREALRGKIKETQNALGNALNETSEGGAQLETFYFRGILHYSFVLVDKRQLYLSVYEQFRGARVRSSVFRIDLTADRELEEYWLNTLDQLKKGSHLPAPWRRAA